MENEVTDVQDKAFHQAITNHDNENVEKMLLSGISAEAIVDDMTPLYRAALCGNTSAMKLLVGAGACVDRRMKIRDETKRRTALNVCADLGELSGAEYLMSVGASPASLDSVNATAAHLLIGGDGFGGSRFEQACDEWRFCVYALLNKMLDQGTNVNQPDNKGYTLLHHAVIKKAPKLIVDTLIRRGADLYRTDNYGMTPFHYACRGGRTDQYDMLARHGVDVHHRTTEGRTPLHICDHPDNFAQIMASKPDLESRDQDGRTALAHTLINSSNLLWSEKATDLIAAGASLDTPDHEGLTPRALTRRRKHATVAAFVAAFEARAAMSRIASGPRTPSVWRTARP